MSDRASSLAQEFGGVPGAPGLVSGTKVPLISMAGEDGDSPSAASIPSGAFPSVAGSCVSMISSPATPAPEIRNLI
nr:hypothetical protein [Microbulbifer sediminum]